MGQIAEPETEKETTAEIEKEKRDKGWQEKGQESPKEGCNNQGRHPARERIDTP